MNVVSVATIVSAICNIINTLKPLAPFVTGLLVKVWPKAVPLLVEATADVNGSRREKAEKALSRIGVPAIKRMIEARHKHKYDPGGNLTAAGHLERALCQLQATEEVVRHLLTLLEDADWRVRQGAVFALGGIRASKAVDALCGVLANMSSERYETREEAAIALGKIGDPGARSFLITALQNDGDWRVRDAAAHALGLIGGHQAIEPLLTALEEGHWRVVMSAAAALGMLKPDEAVVPLINLLDHQEPGVKQEAARALGKIGSTRAIPALVRQIAEDNDPAVQDAATEALAEIDTKKALALLEESEELAWRMSQRESFRRLENAYTSVKRRVSYATVGTYA